MPSNKLNSKRQKHISQVVEAVWALYCASERCSSKSTWCLGSILSSTRNSIRPPQPLILCNSGLTLSSAVPRIFIVGELWEELKNWSLCFSSTFCVPLPKILQMEERSRKQFAWAFVEFSSTLCFPTVKNTLQFLQVNYRWNFLFVYLCCWVFFSCCCVVLFKKNKEKQNFLILMLTTNLKWQAVLPSTPDVCWRVTTGVAQILQ